MRKSLSLRACPPKPRVDALSLEHENRLILLFRLPCTFPRIALYISHFSLYNRIYFDTSSAASSNLEIVFPIFASAD